MKLENLPDNINEPEVQSVLYDMDLLPEQISGMNERSKRANIKRMRVLCGILKGVKNIIAESAEKDLRIIKLLQSETGYENGYSKGYIDGWNNCADILRNALDNIERK